MINACRWGVAGREARAMCPTTHTSKTLVFEFENISKTFNFQEEALILILHFAAAVRG
jgi:hypothetical protein